jgi:hypothetical protein
MALYGGVPMQPGDLMEIEFQTSSRLRVAASVRDRNGYFFGLEFLGLLPNEGDGPDPTHVRVVPGENEMLALFLQRHEAYLHQREFEIKRLRREIQEIRESRREIEMVILRQVLGRSQ